MKTYQEQNMREITKYLRRQEALMRRSKTQDTTETATMRESEEA